VTPAAEQRPWPEPGRRWTRRAAWLLVLLVLAAVAVYFLVR
jgi:hypothetical protein